MIVGDHMPDQYETDLKDVQLSMTRLEAKFETLCESVSNLQKLSESVNKLATSVELQTQKLNAHDESIRTLKTDVQELKLKPAKRWDNVISILISVVVTALFTYALTKAGLK